MKLAVGSDHIGLELKGKLDRVFSAHLITVTDFGTFNEDRMHYPQIAFSVSQAVSAGDYDAGVLICGTGVGMAIAANKVLGVRAVVCSDAYSAVMSREHNNANVLCLGARVLDFDVAETIVNSWLNAEYEGGRHQTRLDMITNYEKR